MLEDNNILQDDATVIAGLLILLTVAYALERRSEQEIIGVFAEQTVVKISRLVIAVVIPFSVSAILVILGSIFVLYAISFASYTITLTNLGKYVMMIGFGTLAIGISWLLGTKATKTLSHEQKGKIPKMGNDPFYPFTYTIFSSLTSSYHALDKLHMSDN